jgi:hypothetical protein
MSGELVMNRFRVRERIGAGGMGVVYRAFDERLQRDVAIKEVTADDPERMLREAQAAARLNHPGIVTVYELGARGDRAVLVSELVPGATLAQLLAANALSDRDVAELGADLCEALAHAHSHGVVHRDLKPQNVIVRDDDGAGRRAKLMDFGIARLAGAPTLTASGEVVGTLVYMAPEQAEGRVAGPPADIYSLALTLYECWAGVNPVRADTPAATVRRIGDQLPSLGRIRPDLPPALVEALDECLRPEAEHRPTPNELRAALDHAIPRLDGDRLVPEPLAVDDAPVGSLPRPSGMRLAGLLGLVALLVLLAAPLSLPGAALVLAALAVPAFVLLPGSLPVLPVAAGALGAGGIGEAYTALAATPVRAWQRAVAGALGWYSALSVALAFGAGPRLGISPRAPGGWESSVADAAGSVLAPWAEPAALLGALAFATGAVALGWALDRRHLSLAALGALVWAAAMTAALGVVGSGALGQRPLVLALAAAAMLGFEHVRRSGARTAPGHGAPGGLKLAGARG